MTWQQSLDLLGLIGLFVQTFVAWAFVILLASLAEFRERHGSLRSFLGAFIALALALSVMSFRFFHFPDASGSYGIWTDGRWPSTLTYAAYMGLKATFVLLLIRGCHEHVPLARPVWLRTLFWPVILLSTASAWVWPRIGDLLVAQAVLMIPSSLYALHVLRQKRTRDLCVICWALGAQAGAWALHGIVALSGGRWGLGYVSTFGSYLDLAVQLGVATGLVVGLMRETHRWRLKAEREREELALSAAQDEKLLALGRVVSGVAHELNNPLTVISGRAELMQVQRPEDGAARVIAEQAQRCRGIVRNLSALAGQSTHRRRKEEIERLCHRVQRGLNRELLTEGRRVVIAPMQGLRCNVDTIGLEQVIANLVTNALQASPTGGRVDVSARRLRDGIELAVQDQGPGIPAALRERLFEPFFTTKEPGQGTGLGLSIAHAIARHHDGSIRVEAGADGRGALFRVWIKDVVEPTTLPIDAREVPERDRRLLIVDDEPLVRQIVRSHAELKGWKVREVDSAERALEVLEAEEVVLCDLRMPGIGGAGLYDRLRRERPEQLDRVLFFTGDLASTESVRFAERCRQPLLQKPLDFEELWPRLHAAAGRRGGIGAASS